MRKRKYVCGTVLLFLILLCTIAVSCEKKQKEAPSKEVDPLSSTYGRLLDFTYEFGSYNEGQWEYRVFEKDGKTYMEAHGYNGVRLNKDGKAAKDALEKISDIMGTYGICAWDGFDERDDDILDGFSFTMTAVFENGTVEASGYMKYPEGFEEGHEALSACLAQLAK